MSGGGETNVREREETGKGRKGRNVLLSLFFILKINK